MRHFLGLDETALARNHSVKMIYDPEALINAHALICGQSGTGKSYQSMRMLESAARGNVEVDVFDVHDELDGIRDAVAVRYSQHTKFGINPMILSTDVHVGGVDRQTDFIIGLIDQVSPLGINQRTALRNLIVQTYAHHQIYQDKPFTWRKKVITEAKRDEILAAPFRHGELAQYYPTLADLILFGKRKVVELTAGTNNPTVLAYEELSKTLKRLRTANTALGRKLDPDQIRKTEEKIEKLRNQCIELWATHINALETGEEPENIVRFESAQMVSGLVQRLELLAGAGTFRANEPPFGAARVRVHQIKALTREQQIVFVKLKLREIFDRHKADGATASGTEVRHIVFLDEAHQYFVNDPADIISIIAKEARKFGVGLWCASQSPTEFPEHFLTNVGLTVLLGVHPTYWGAMISKMRMTEETLSAIRPKEVIAAKLQSAGASDPPFARIVVPNDRTINGQRALNAQTAA